MESSEEEDDFMSHEWITPQSHVNSLYQSHTEKGIRKLCCDLLDLKDAVEGLCGNGHVYLSFLRVCEEVMETKQELMDLQKHVSSQGILVQDLINGVCHEIEEWSKCDTDLEPCSIEDIFPQENLEDRTSFFETLDILLAEHKTEEALKVFEAEEKKSKSKKSESDSSYEEGLLNRKSMIVDQLVKICKLPNVGDAEMKEALLGLVKLGKGSLGHKLLLKRCGSHLHKSIEAFIPSCLVYMETYAATLSNFVFSVISLARKDSISIFGDSAAYTSKLVQWAEFEIESFVRTVKENAPLSDSTFALRSASVCLEAAFRHSLLLESQGLKFSKLVLVLLRPYLEEVLDMNFRRARRRILEFSGLDDSPEDIFLANNGKKFMSIVVDILEQLTPTAITHFGTNILSRLLILFDKYVDSLTKDLPGPTEDDVTLDQKEADSDAQHLILLGTACSVADELLPAAVSRVFKPKEGGDSTVATPPFSPVEFKDWRRHLQHSLDKLRDHLCRQYVLSFIYSKDEKACFDARMYVTEKDGDLFWDSDPMPSLPFQDFFGRLMELAAVARETLHGKEKVQKVFIARLAETVAMWLSEEQEFWEVLGDDSIRLSPSGLQQLVFDMHFLIEIAVCGGYPSRNIHLSATAVINRAIETFSRRGIDPLSALPEDDWFIDNARSAINTLTFGSLAFNISDLNGHSTLPPFAPEFNNTPSSPSSTASSDSFASATMAELDSPSCDSDSDA